MKKIFVYVLIFFALTVASLFSQAGSPDKPLKGTWDFKMKKIWETSNAGEDLLGQVQGIQVADDGRIYIMDSKNCKTYILGADGKYISFFGPSGEGPGEIKTYHGGTQLFVLDDCIAFCERGRVHYFQLDGTYRNSVHISQRLTPRAFVSPDQLISAPVISAGSADDLSEILLYNIKDESRKVIAQYKTFKKATDTQQNGNQRVTVAIIVGGVTPMMLVEYRDGKIYFGKNDYYRIDSVDLKGKALAQYRIGDREAKPVSDRFKKVLAKGLGDIPAKMVKNIIDGLPDKAAFFSSIAVDKNGLVYAFVSDPNNESNQMIDIFSPEGKYLYSGEIRVGEGSRIETFYLKDDLLMLVTENEEGDFILGKYNIQIPVS